MTRSSWQGTIYVDTPLSTLALAERLAKGVGAAVDARATIAAEHVDFEVTTNDERRDLSAVGAGEDAFLSFPYVVELFAHDRCDRRGVVAEVAAALAALDQVGARYVTAADFEPDLPGGGRSEA